MSPLDQVIAELEQEQTLLELTLVCLRGRRALRAASAPDIMRIVGRPQSALLPPAVGERLRSETAKAEAKPSRPRHVAKAKATTPRDSTRPRATESPTPIPAERSGRVARPAAGMGAGAGRARVLDVLDRATEGLSAAEIAIRIGWTGSAQGLRKVLSGLKEEGRATLTGRSRAARWARPSNRRRATLAPTPRAGQPPAAPAGRIQIVDDVDLEPVWNGTLDRVGRAPSLVGSR